jgi:hypothetical protein
MTRFITTCCLAAITLAAAPSARAASVTIDDSLANDTISLTFSGFDLFTLPNGQSFEDGGSHTVVEPETRSINIPILTGFWTASSVTAENVTVVFLEPGVPRSQGVSDVLLFTYHQFRSDLAGLVVAFASDADPNLLPDHPNAAAVQEGTPYEFDNSGITASAVSDASDVTAVPEPGGLLLLGTGIVGIAHRVRRRRSHD